MEEPFPIFDFYPRNLPKDILEAIGLVAACSAQTESIVQMGIGGCLGLDAEYSVAVTTHMSAPMRDQTLRAAAEIRIESLDDLDKLDVLLDAVNTACANRNDYLHHTWCRDPKTGNCFTTRISARGSVNIELKPISVTKIAKDAIAIYDAGMSLMQFLGPRDLLPPIPSVRRPRDHKTKPARKKRREMALKATTGGKTFK